MDRYSAFLLSASLSIVLATPAANATSYHQFQSAGNSATLQFRRTMTATVMPYSGETIQKVEYYLRYPAADWPYVSSFQTTDLLGICRATHREDEAKNGHVNSHLTLLSPRRVRTVVFRL